MNYRDSRRRREAESVENIFEDITAENFPNLEKETAIQVQEAKRVPNRINPKRTIPTHTVIKMAKVKERIINASREKQQVMYKGTPITVSADLSAETLQA